MFLVGCIMAPAGAHEDIETQIASITSAIEEAPRNAALLRRRGDLHRLHRDWASAFADLERAEELDPHYEGFALLRARLLVDVGALRSAQRTLDSYLAQVPDSADALFLRAEVRLRSGELEEAAKDSSLAISLVETPSPEHYLARAGALASLGREHLPRAIDGLDEGIARLGRAASLDLRAVELEVELGRYDEALARLGAVSSRSPRKERWLARRGDVLFTAGRCDEAREAYTSTLDAIERLRPDKRRTRNTIELEGEVTARLRELTGEIPR